MLEDFNVTNLDMDPADFMNYIANIFYSGVQSGHSTYLCQILTHSSFQDEEKQYEQLYQLGKLYGLEAIQSDVKDLQNITINTNDMRRQWMYQVCTEFGWFTVSSAVNPISSQLVNSSYMLEYCKKIFSKDIPPPAVNDTNDSFGALQNNGRNILFFNAQEDPWQYAGMRHVTMSARQKNQRAVMITCEGCSHCVDLWPANDNDPRMLTAAKTYGMSQLAQWLDEDK